MAQGILVVKGDPDKIIKQWRAAVGRGLKNDVLDTAEETAAYLLRRVRQNAHKAGKDWGRVADQGQVKRLASNVVLEFPGEAFDLEYGTEGVPPKPIIRQSINQMGPYLKGYFNKQIKIRLFGRGDL